MSLDVKDVTGTPRPEREIIEAIKYLEKQILSDPMAMTKDGQPRLIQYITMKDALKELLMLRRLVATTHIQAAETVALPERKPVFDQEAPTHPGKANAIPPPPSIPDPYIEAEGVYSPNEVPTGKTEKT